MEADYPVLIDACVLANHAVTDLLLRLADGPRLFIPRWTDAILQETRRTLLVDLEWPTRLVESRDVAFREYFPEAWIRGYEPLIPSLGNDPKDRHVLAAAIWGKCGALTTFNLRDFPEEHLAPWEVEAVHPADLLTDLYDLNAAVVLSRLHDIATDRKRPLTDVIRTLSKSVPSFAAGVADRLDLDLEG